MQLLNLQVDHYYVDQCFSQNICQGGQSQVLIVRDSQQKLFAAKTYPFSDLTASDSAFYNELKALQTLGKHENIIKMETFNRNGIIQDSTTNIQAPFILLEYCQLGSLLEILRKSPLKEPTARYLFVEILKALNFCHNSNIYHYDIKPDNILIQENNGKCQVKLADFGLSLGKESLNKRGTTQYQNPQMLLGKQTSGVQADMFGLGITLFMMIRGKPPFQAATLQDGLYSTLINNPKLFWRCFEWEFQEFSESFKNLIERMLTYQKKERLCRFEEIINHDWLRGEIRSDEAVLQDLRNILAKQ